MTATGRPLVVVGVFLLACVAALPLLLGVQHVSGLNPDVLRLTVFVTAIGAAVVAVVWRGRLPYPAVVTGRRRVAVVAASLLVVAVVAHLALARAAGGGWGPLAAGVLPVPIAVEVVLQVLGAAAEEVGWRGVVQPVLETRWSALTAVTVTGVLFGLGHVYVVAAGLVHFAVFLVGAVSLSLVLGAVTVGASFGVRVVAATLVHWAVNVFTLVRFGDGDDSLRWSLITSGAMLLTAMPAVVVLVRGRRAR